jgi:hypothetical protein
MIGRSFNSLLGGRRLGTLLRWQRVHHCPCAIDEGEADQSCKVCSGTGRYFDAWSEPFTAGLVGQDAQSMQNITQRTEDGVIGDSVLVLPSSALCYADIAFMDRIQLVNTTDTIEWVLSPGPGVKLPSGCTVLKASARSVDGTAIVDVPIPVPGPDGRITVLVTTTVRFRAARLYEVLRDLSKVREFGIGLPKRIPLKRIDITVR